MLRFAWLALILAPHLAYANMATYPSSDFSGSVASTNVVQQVIPINPYRNGCEIWNTSSNAETIYIRLGTGPIPLAAGAEFMCGLASDAIYITSATAGSTFTAKQQ